MNPKNTKAAGTITRSSSKDKTNQVNPGGLSTETVKISGKEEVVEVVSIPSNSNPVVIHFVEKYGENFSIVKPSHKVACLTCKHAIWSIFEPFDHIKSQQNIDTQKMEEAQIRCYCPLMHLISWAKTTTEVTLCNGPHKD